MIEARFSCRGGRICGFSVSGHAGYAARGEDIVCASVTSAVQLTANGVTETAGIPAKVTAKENRVTLALPDGCNNPAALAMLAALRLHLKLLAQDYPNTIVIADTEVQ